VGTVLEYTIFSHLSELVVSGGWKGGKKRREEIGSVEEGLDLGEVMELER